MCNRREKAAWPAITVLRFEKNRSSGNVQKGQNFGLALNIGPAFSDRFQVLIITNSMTYHIPFCQEPDIDGSQNKNYLLYVGLNWSSCVLCAL